MSYTSERKARILAQLTQVQAALDNLYSIQTEMAATGAKSYEFESGEGRQKTVRRSFKEIDDSIQVLEAKESHLLNAKWGTGVISVRVRRKNGRGHVR